MSSRAGRSGFTLIEVLVVCVILGGLALIGTVGFRNFVEHARLESATHALYTALSDARSAALSAERGEQYGVAIEPGRFIRFRGGEYDPADSQNQVTEFAGITATAELEGGATTVVFEKRTGRAAQSGVITLVQDATNASTTLTIAPSGVVSPE